MLLALLLCFSGFTGLCLSLAAAVQGTGWSLGLVQWCAVLMCSALLLVLLLPYRPRLVLSMAGASLLACPLAALARF